MQILIAHEGGINWDWFIAFRIEDDGRATVIGEDRFHKDTWPQYRGYEDASIGRYEVIEDRSEKANGWSIRKVVALRIYGIFGTVDIPLVHAGMERFRAWAGVMPKVGE